MSEEVEDEPKVARATRMNLVLLERIPAKEGDPDTMLRMLADETAGLSGEGDITKWMEDNNFVGELLVAAFRRGTDERADPNGRLMRTRKPTKAFVTN